MWDYISTPTTKYARLKLELPSATEVPKEGLTCSCTSPNKIPQHIFLGLGVDALHAHARTRMLVNLSARARTRASRRKRASRHPRAKTNFPFCGRPFLGVRLLAPPPPKKQCWGCLDRGGQKKNPPGPSRPNIVFGGRGGGAGQYESKRRYMKKGS